jgi:hypothetical protein
MASVDYKGRSWTLRRGFLVFEFPARFRRLYLREFGASGGNREDWLRDRH